MKILFSKTGFQRVMILLACICSCRLLATAQYFDIKGNTKHVAVPFKMVREMIIIQLNINNKGPFNFILDTGVGIMLITDPKLVDSIDIISKHTIKIAGLGEGDDYEAYVTSPLNITINGLTSHDVGAAILKKDHFGLSNFAGMPIHGLLGYEFFNSLAVKLDFADSTLTCWRPKDLRVFRKGTKIPLHIEDRKPYLNAEITFPDGSKVNDKLVLDLGAGHPLSLENMIQAKGLPQRFIAANLGIGLTGPIDGFLSRVPELELGKFKIMNVITSFPKNMPDVLSVKRDGNLGMGILKRFTVIIDYADSCIYLRPGAAINASFEHDMSGMEYYCAGDELNRIIISRVEPGSAADEIGLEKNDEIVAINLKPVTDMSLQTIDALFKSQNERNLLLQVFHDHKLDNVIITLKRRI